MATIILGIFLPVAAFWLLRWWTRLDRVDRGAMAVHYGSTALVTYTAALMRLEASDVPYEGYVATLLTVPKVPGIVVGLSLAKGPQREGLGHTRREVVLGRSVLLLVGGLAVSLLLEPGMLTGRQLGAVRQAGPGLISFAVIFPLVVGIPVGG